MITKEQLAKENGELRAQVQNLSLEDSTLRKRFAKVLGRTERDVYSTSMRANVADLSWEEIFCEIGKLMAFRDFQSWKENIEFRIDRLTPETKADA